MGTHGVFTYKTVRGMGILSPELARWIRLGRIVKVGHGVYRLTAYPSEGLVSDMAAVLAEVGDDSYLYGETALGFLELCPTRSYVAYVATPNRCRRKLADGIVVVHAAPGYEPFHPSGIPCQHVQDAILASVGTVDRVRLREAVDVAEGKGFFTAREADELRKRVEHGKSAAQ